MRADKDGLIYLASPYYSPDAAVREERYRQACLATGKMLASGYKVYSPIVHNHPIAQMVDLPKDWRFWREIDLLMISKCSHLCVLCIDGWSASIGVTAEIRFATDSGIPVDYLKMSDLDALS